MKTDYIWRCDLSAQYYEYLEDINSAVKAVLESGVYIHGKNVELFEKKFAEYIEVSYGIGVNNGTDALIQCLLSAGVSKDDEVITTPFTAIPTYSAIRFVGAKPIFVDIEKDTFLMDIEKVQQKITEKTKVILPVHLFGNVVNIPKLKEKISSNIIIIEDCAQSHGATINNTKAGSLGDLSAFSFYPTKNLGGYGDGGMVLTNSEQVMDIVKKRRMYGMVNKDEIILDGTNTRLDEIQAAILLVKLKYLDEMNNKRKLLFETYSNNLPRDYITPQVVRHNVSSAYHILACYCKERRDELATFLEKSRIQTNIYYKMPLYKQKPFIDQYGSHEELDNVEDVTKKIIALPFYPEMNKNKVDYVLQKVREFYR